jgi:NAD-dependent dihydropyrimidine dehydrogenase PreA subunit
MTSDATDEVYALLATALDTVPNGYPRTASGVEVELLAALIPIESAQVAAVMGHRPLTVAEIAQRAGLPEAETARRLDGLATFDAAERIEADRAPRDALTEGDAGAQRDTSAAGNAGAKGDVVAPAAGAAASSWQLGPFWPGIFDALVPTMSAEAAALMERYMAEGGAAGIMGADPPIGRVLPASDAARADWILPYDDVRRVIEQTAAVTVNDCVCRLDRAKLGHACEFPTHVCMILHDTVPEDGAGVISRQEALDLLAETDRLGLVHVATNVGSGWEFVCNCCGCCCHFLRSLTEWRVENAVVSNYEAIVDLEACTGCGTCEERCQIDAIGVVARGEPHDHTFAVVNVERCIGCGVCVTGCPNEAVTLRRLPEARVTVPPADPEAWGRERLRRREH